MTDPGEGGAAGGDVWNDPAVARGIRRQAELRREREARGETVIGWKAGFSRSVQEELGLGGAVVGFLTSAGVLPDGAEVAVRGWTRPALEPELAVHLDRDVEPGSSPEEAAEAIAAVGPAIEIVDVDAPLSEVETVVGGDIYQRGVILGEADPARRGGSVEGIRVKVSRSGEQVAETDDPTGPTGPLPAMVAHVASWLGATGERLRAGQFVICGSTTPLVAVEPGDRIVYRCEPLGELAVAFIE